MSAPRCPKCGARPASMNGNLYHCMMCGRDYPGPIQPKPVVREIRITEKSTKTVSSKSSIKPKESEIEIMAEKTPCGKKGTCSNCLRDNIYISDKRGLCASCHRAVDGISENSPEYSGVLEAAARKYGKKPVKAEKDLIETLKERRHELLVEAEEITKTISVIEKYQRAA